jgi:hypothetical protein
MKYNVSLLQGDRLFCKLFGHPRFTTFVSSAPVLLGVAPQRY